MQAWNMKDIHGSVCTHTKWIFDHLVTSDLNYQLIIRLLFKRGSGDYFLSSKGLCEGPVGNQFVNSRAPHC
jgi:hypothetical protein